MRLLGQHHSAPKLLPDITKSSGIFFLTSLPGMPVSSEKHGKYILLFGFPFTLGQCSLGWQLVIKKIAKTNTFLGSLPSEFTCIYLIRSCEIKVLCRYLNSCFPDTETKAQGGWTNKFTWQSSDSKFRSSDFSNSCFSIIKVACHLWKDHSLGAGDKAWLISVIQYLGLCLSSSKHLLQNLRGRGASKLLILSGLSLS